MQAAMKNRSSAEVETVKRESSAEETSCSVSSSSTGIPPPPLPNSDPPSIPPATVVKEIMENWICSTDDSPSLGTEEEENLDLDEILNRIGEKDGVQIQRHDPPAILVEQDVEVEQILHSSASAAGPEEIKSIRIDGDNRQSLLEPEDEEQQICDSGRRRSPVNVNEWVASLPIPSAIDAEDGHVNLSDCSNSSRGQGRLQKCHNKREHNSASDECDTRTSELCKPGWEGKTCPSELPEQATNERSKLVIGLKRLRVRAGRLDRPSCREDDRCSDCDDKPDSSGVDGDALSPDVDPDLSSYRRLSAVFEAIEEENKDNEERSDDDGISNHSNEGGEPNEPENTTDVDAKKVLATEVKSTIENDKLPDGPTTIKCTKSGCENIGNEIPTRKKVERHCDSDTAHFSEFGGSESLQVIKKKWMPSTDSLTSSSESSAHKAVPTKPLEGHSKLEGLLLSRCVDPAQLLIDLGFGGPETSNLSRVPTRFLTRPSMAKGICVEGFLRHQEEISILDDAAYQGGVDGLYSSAMLETLAQQSSSFESQGSQGEANKDLPATKYFTSFVDRMVNRRSSLLRSHTMSSLPTLSAKREKGASSFRAVAQSVLSLENRRFLKEQEFVHEKVKRQQSKKRLVLGGHAYNVDEDDISVVTAVASDDGTVENDEAPAAHAASGARTRIRRPPTHNDAAPLSRMDTSTSLTSTCSVDSDWSDEEIEEMEKIFGNITHRLNACESRPKFSDGAVAQSVGSKWWQTLKNRRPTAVQKMLVGKKFGRSTDSESAEARRHKFSQSSAPSFDLEDCKNPSTEADTKDSVESSGVQSGDAELGEDAAAIQGRLCATQTENGSNPEIVAFRTESLTAPVLQDGNNGLFVTVSNSTVTSTSHGYSTPSQQHRHLIRGITHCDERIPIRFARQQIE